MSIGQNIWPVIILWLSCVLTIDPAGISHNLDLFCEISQLELFTMVIISPTVVRHISASRGSSLYTSRSDYHFMDL